MPHSLTMAQGVFSGLALIVGTAYANFWKTGQGFSLFRVVFYTSDQPMVIVGLDGKPIHVNPAAERLFGWSEKEFRKMAFPEFTHREDIDTDVELFGELKAGVRDSYLFRKRWYTKMDTLIMGLLSCSVIPDDDGELIAVLATITPTPGGADAKLEKVIKSVTESMKKDSADQKTGIVAGTFKELRATLGTLDGINKLGRVVLALIAVVIALVIVFGAFYLFIGGGFEQVLELWKDKPSTP